MSLVSRLVAIVAFVAFPSSAAAQGHDGGDSGPPPGQSRSNRGPAFAEPDIVSTLGLEGMGHRQGVGVGANAFFEGPNWGVFAQYQATVSGAGADLRAIQQAHLTLNYAILASRTARLRIEGGVGYTGAGPTHIYSPILGISGALGVLGAVQLEGSLRVAPLPIGQAESSVGFAIGLGQLGLRAGIKRILVAPLEGVPELDDASFQGGYLGIAWTL